MGDNQPCSVVNTVDIPGGRRTTADHHGAQSSAARTPRRATRTGAALAPIAHHGMDADFERTGILNPAVEPHRVQ